MKITCENLCFKYPGSNQFVLKDLDIVFPASTTLLKGYSGCGKSTLLRLASGLLKPTAGRIKTEGISALGSRTFFQTELSFVFQNLNLLPLATVDRNLQISAQIAGIDFKECEKWMEALGLSDLRKRVVERLSGGQRQRVAIARAISKNPKVLFLDEPTSGLDDKNTEIIKQAVRDFTAGGRTICVAATHDHRLEEIADELVDFHTLISLEK